MTTEPPQCDVHWGWEEMADILQPTFAHSQGLMSFDLDFQQSKHYIWNNVYLVWSKVYKMDICIWGYWTVVTEQSYFT